METMGAFLEFCIAQRENCVESHRDFGRLIFTAPKLTNATGYLKLYVCAYRKGHTYGHQGGKAAAGGGGGGMNWEIGIDMYTLMCIKWITNKKKRC